MFQFQSELSISNRWESWNVTGFAVLSIAGLDLQGHFCLTKVSLQSSSSLIILFNSKKLRSCSCFSFAYVLRSCLNLKHRPLLGSAHARSWCKWVWLVTFSARMPTWIIFCICTSKWTTKKIFSQCTCRMLNLPWVVTLLSDSSPKH